MPSPSSIKRPAAKAVVPTITGRIEPVRSAPGYQAALVGVAALMLLLPLVYVGLMALLGAGLWWYATHAVGMFEHVHGGWSLKFAVILYLGPLTIGGIALLFMLKPLFARPAESALPMTVEPDEEPALHAFVARLAEAVGAPKPRRIDVVCEVNASAGFRRGLLSLMGSDLVLTIGLPLAACQDLRQFTGVLAHELGHFSQGVGMRACYLIRRVNGWFARVVYQRDAMDARLEEWSRGDVHLAVNLVLMLARFFVWLTRGILRILMGIGHLASQALSRQMEYDADRHAARVIGSEAYAAALRELPVLGLAHDRAIGELQDSWRERRLADDVPALVAFRLSQVPQEVRDGAIRSGLDVATGMYASHPATRDRIAALEREPGEGIFAGAGPARQLFRDFTGYSQASTLGWYRNTVHLPIQPGMLRPTQDLIAAAERDAAAAAIADRRLGPLWRGATLFAPAGDPDPACDQESLAKELGAAEQRLERLVIALACESIGGDIPVDGLDIPDTRRSTLLAAARTCRDRIATLRHQAHRVAAQAASRLPGSGAESELLRGTLAALAKVQIPADAAKDLAVTVSVLLAVLQQPGRGEDERLLGELRAKLEAIPPAIQDLCKPLQGRPYPFDHSSKGITLAGYIHAQSGHGIELGDAVGCLRAAVDNLYRLHGRCLARWAELAEAGAAAPPPAAPIPEAEVKQGSAAGMTYELE